MKVIFYFHKILSTAIFKNMFGQDGPGSGLETELNLTRELPLFVASPKSDKLKLEIAIPIHLDM